MRNQQKLVLRVLARDKKITITQYEQGLSKLENLPPEESGKLNWIAQEFQLFKEDIMGAFQKAKELVANAGSIDAAVELIKLPEKADEAKLDVPKDRTESEISIQKGPTRLGGKSSYQQGEDFKESKIKHAPKLKKQSSLGGSSTSRFVDFDESAKPEDEGLMKSSDTPRPLSDIKAPSNTERKLKRASSKIIEPKKTPSKAEENLILEAPPPIEEKQEKAFEIEQIQSEEVLKGEVELQPPPMVSPNFKEESAEGYEDVELDPIDDFDDDLVQHAPPPLNRNRTESELIDLADDEIEEIEEIDDWDEIEEINGEDQSNTKSNRLRPRARRHRRRK